MTPEELYHKRKHCFEYSKFKMKRPRFAFQKLLFLLLECEAVRGGVKLLQWERELLGSTFNL